MNYIFRYSQRRPLITPVLLNPLRLQTSSILDPPRLQTSVILDSSNLSLGLGTLKRLAHIKYPQSSSLVARPWHTIQINDVLFLYHY